ncbi:MAG TPA: hypothetical protein VEJ20_09635 [Candidatus Eremiobacteraceae bacterium]|nr:hypothetical protein [Candidatus Eremiobacteraceae bacterium]
MRSFASAVSIFAIAGMALACMGAARVPALPVPPNAAMIYAAGNDDYSGFRIVVQPGGQASAIDGAGRAAQMLPNELADRFFADLDAAGRSGASATSDSAACAGSDSLASEASLVNESIEIRWAGNRWSDLRCATDAGAARLLADATAIEHALYVQAYRSATIVTWSGNTAGSSNVSAYAPQGYSTTYGGLNFGFNSGSLMGSASAGYPGGSNPLTGLPTTALPGNSLPVTSIPGSLPLTGLPSGTTFSGLPTTSPFGGGPFSGGPFGGGP